MCLTPRHDGSLYLSGTFARLPAARYGCGEMREVWMEDDTEQRPESLLPYDDWIEAAMRHVVAQAVEYVPRTVCPASTISI